MYLTHFGLQQLPFSITPDPDFFFVGNKRGEILEALIYSVVHGDGIIKVTGEVGCGKTMLCRRLERRLPSHIEVIYLVNPTLNHDQVIFTIAGELDLPIQGKRVDEVIRLLHSALITKHAAGKQVVLLIEEAQAMSMQTLEEIRLFSNLETAHYKLLQIVLFGQPELDDHLNVPSMRQLKERITNSFKLPPLTATTIPDYLMFRLRAAGYHGSDLFDEAAIKLINRVSQGIVRRISILADKSLLAAFADNAHSVGEAHVLAAIEDSEFSNTTAGAMRSPRRLVTAAIAVLLVGAAIWFAWLNHGPSQVQLATTKKAPATPVASKSTAAAPFVLVAEKAVTAPISTSAAAAASAPTSTPLISSNVVSPVSTAPTAATSNLPAPVNTLAVVKPPVTAPTPKVDASALSPNLASATARLSLDERLKLSTNWLNSQANDAYSIQLGVIAPSNQEDILRYLKKMESDLGFQQVQVYSAQKSNAAYFGVVLGSFSSRNEAVAMINMLSAQWNLQPQLRTIGGIKRELSADKSKEINSSK